MLTERMPAYSRARALPPQFAIYNAVLRRWPEAESERGNRYTTTIHVLVSAVIKLARVTKFAEGARLYRGTGGRMALPVKFSQADEHGCKGFTEWGFMSTTANRAVALTYSGVREGRAVPTVLVIEVTAIDRGASIAFFSQYQGEEEVLFLPMGFLAPNGPEQLEVTPHGIVMIVMVRVNINLSMSTIEELLEGKKRGHLASFSFLLNDLRRELHKIAADGGAKQRRVSDLLRIEHTKFDFRSETHTVDGLIAWAVSLVEVVRAEHEGVKPGQFAKDTVYKRLVTEMLDAGAMAASLLHLYLEDSNRILPLMMRMSLVDAHRSLISFRARNILMLEGEARRAAAVQQCQLMGMVMERIDEVSRAGETPLVCAVANGTVGPAAMALLIEAGADVGDGTALGVAAEHGHLEAVVALLGAKAPVDSVATGKEVLLLGVGTVFGTVPLADSEARPAPCVGMQHASVLAKPGIIRRLQIVLVSTYFHIM